MKNKKKKERGEYMGAKRGEVQGARKQGTGVQDVGVQDARLQGAGVKGGGMKKAGAALVAAAMVMGLSGCASVEVTGVSLAEKQLMIEAGQSVSLSAQYTYSSATPSEKQINDAFEKAAMKWLSSDDKVATVDEKGAVTAKGAGSAVITVADSKGNVKADLAVTVIVPVKTVTAEKEMVLDILKTQTKSVGLTVTPQDASGVEISYTSSDEKVATVNDKGEVTPIGEGEAEITVTVKSDSESGKAETKTKTKVTLKKLAQSIEFEQSEGVLAVGNALVLKPYGLPEGVGKSKYTFASSDEMVATVNDKGEVTAVSVGKCEITATSTEGHKAVFALTVSKAGSATGGNNGGTTANGGKTGTSNGGGKTGTTTGGTGGKTNGGTGGGTATGGGTTPTPPPAPTPPPTPTPPPAPTVPTCVIPGPGHSQVGQCPVCGNVNGGIYTGGPDGGQTEGTEGEGW